jgi:hypothetical protein
MRLTWGIIAALLACQIAGLFDSAGGQDKAPPAAAKPTMTPGPGEQKKAVRVELKCTTPEAVIRYTLDGSTPGTATGTVYAEPIAIDKTTTLTAVVFAKDLAPSPSAYGTYLFNLKEGLATFHIGNSLTNTTARFADYVRTTGTIHKYQSFTAGGALTWQLWDLQLPKRQQEWDTKLAGYQRIDHFTVQPRDFTKNSVDHEAEYAIRFFELIRKHSPEMQPWYYAEWVEKNRGRPTDQGKIPSSLMKQTFPAQSWEESMAAMLLYNEDLQAKVAATYKEGKRPRVLPSCLAMGWIKNMIDHNQVPGAEKESFYPLLFSDGVHPNVKGGYLVDLTWYAAFYRESPEGKVLPVGTGLTNAQAKVMQQLAWSVVKNYPDCGLYVDGTEAVAAPQIVGESGNKAVTLTSKTPGAWFRYTLDGTPPTRTRGYVYCGIVTLQPGSTLKAIAYKSGMADSAVVEMDKPK